MTDIPEYKITEQDEAMLENNFIYHAPIAELKHVERYQNLRDAFRLFATQILKTCPPSRERSVALTNLEQAMFWSNASIARNEK